ncbi:MAG: 30S ribosomal protein S16 [Candidatus Pacebacteria bacterium]|nr:30S ribosomal protein S16 [Candidatus Paceibacterota bacterium]
MLRIRLSRVGRKNMAQFRITVADIKRSPTGKFIEIIGNYNSHTKEKVFKKDRAEYWISKGAQPSPTVYNLFVDAGVIKGDKVTSWRPKKKSKEELEKIAKAEAEAKAKKEEVVKEEASKGEEKTDSTKEKKEETLKEEKVDISEGKKKKEEK